MNIDQILEKQENAILEGNSYLTQCFSYWQQSQHDLEEYHYLTRNLTVLCSLPYRKGMTLKTQLCERDCPHQGNLDNMHGFEDIETMHKQLESEKVCSFKYFRQHPTSFKVGIHSDILDNLFYQRYNNATLIFEDCHDLSIKLERAMSSTLNTLYVQNICKNFLSSPTKQSWEQNLNHKLNLLTKNFKQPTPITQQQYNILLPLISFGVRVLQHTTQHLILESNQAAKLVSECTMMISEQEFLQYLKQFNLQVHLNCNLPKYPSITNINYEEYLDELFSLQQHRAMFTQWYIFLKQAFELQDSQELDIKSNILQCPKSDKTDKMSIDKSIMAAEQQNYRDYKLVLFVDILQPNKFHCSLICLNPLAGMSKLCNSGVTNVILITQHSYPPKLFKTELNLPFVFYPQIPVQDLKLNCKIVAKIQNQPIDFLQTEQDSLILELGKQLQMFNYQVSDHGVITLFSSKSFMQKCQDIWGEHLILQSLGMNREFQWLKYQNKSSVQDCARLFLNKCRFNSIIGDTMPSIYMTFNDMFLDSLQEAFQILQRKSHKQTLKNSTQITVLLIGVPWASQFLYPSDNETEPQVHLNCKLEWLKSLQNMVSCISMVNAIRNISRLQHILDKLSPCNLIVMDEKFQQKILWKDQKMPEILKFQEVIKELQKITPVMARSENLNLQPNQTQKVESKKVQNIKIHIQEPNPLKRKIMLNKVQLGDLYNLNKKSLPLAQNTEKITLEQLIGFTDEKEGSKKDEDKCVICWSNTINTEMSKSSKCGHVACKECWRIWLQTKLECPLCRARVREKFLTEI